MENIFKDENWKEIFLEDVLDTSKQRIYISDFGRVRIRNFEDKTFRLVDLEIKNQIHVFKYLDSIKYYETYPVHRAVAGLFVEKKDSDGLLFCVHKDYNLHNNHYKNLKWLDYKSLKEFHREKQLFYDEARYNEIPSIFSREQLIEIIEELELDGTYPTLLKLANKYNVSTAQISRIKLCL